MSIGEDLAEARRLAGLSVTEVSRRTCIRATIIGAIERGEFEACGGDFYARGHIRAIAKAVGADPGPLIAAYDAARPAPLPVAAADLFGPARPVRLRRRGRVNWAGVLVLALVAVLGVVVYQLSVGSRHTPAAPAAAGAGLHRVIHRHTRPAASRAAKTPAPNPHAHIVAIDLTAMEDCWVEFTTPPAGTCPRRSSPAARRVRGPSGMAWT